METTKSGLEELCTLVAELVDHVRNASLGTQSVNVVNELSSLRKRVEDLRDQASIEPAEAHPSFEIGDAVDLSPDDSGGLGPRK